MKKIAAFKVVRSLIVIVLLVSLMLIAGCGRVEPIINCKESYSWICSRDPGNFLH